MKTNPRARTGPSSEKPRSVTYVWAVDATVFDTDGDMDHAALVAHGPGRMETWPVSSDPAPPMKGVPADRITVWQNKLIYKNELRPGRRSPSGFDSYRQALGLRSPPAIYADRDRHDRRLARAQAQVSAGKNEPARPATTNSKSSTKSSDPVDGGYQIKRCSP